MKVKLMRYTPEPELMIAKAMRSCRHKEPAHELELEKKPSYYVKKAKEWGHLSTAEHVSFTFSIEGVSRACTHQLVRHRIASYSQQSQREVDMNEAEFVTPDKVDETQETTYEGTMRMIWDVYEDLVEEGVPEEDARFILPNATKTNIVVTMNGRSLLHFFDLRLSEDAQWEIRELASRMLEEVKPKAQTLFNNYEPISY